MKNENSKAKGLLQSPEEWMARNQALVTTINELIKRHITTQTYRGLDLGCQKGVLTDSLEGPPDFKWCGVDPIIQEPLLSAKGTELLPGWAHQLPFPDSHFDCVVLANVYEHIQPEQREASLTEISRVLVKGGILVGQLPNPYFPIEAHSRLPFMGWLPQTAQEVYWRLSPVPWKHNKHIFYVVSIKDLRRRSEVLGFETVIIRNFNYPIEAIPRSIRGVARVLEPTMRVVPWSWQFVFRKKH